METHWLKLPLAKDTISPRRKIWHPFVDPSSNFLYMQGLPFLPIKLLRAYS